MLIYLILGSSHGGTVESDLREDRLNSDLAEIETKVKWLQQTYYIGSYIEAYVGSFPIKLYFFDSSISRETLSSSICYNSCQRNPKSATHYSNIYN